MNRLCTCRHSFSALYTKRRFMPPDLFTDLFELQTEEVLALPRDRRRCEMPMRILRQVVFVVVTTVALNAMPNQQPPARQAPPVQVAPGSQPGQRGGGPPAPASLPAFKKTILLL